MGAFLVKKSPFKCEDFRETVMDDVTKTIEDEKFRKSSHSEDGGNRYW